MSNETAPTNPNAPTPQVPARREFKTVEDDSSIAYLMDTARFEHCYRIAGAMAKASLIPKHLKGETYEQTQANCFLIVNQAMRWQLDPFAVAPETYEVGGKLGFQGKLVAAVINARGNLVEKLSYTFNDAKGDALEVTVSGRIHGEDNPRTVTVSVGQAKTQNQMWTKDPQQKLIYTGAIKWARRHKPEVVLGVMTDDDAEVIREEARFIAAHPAQIGRPDFTPAVVSAPPNSAPAVTSSPPTPETPKRSRKPQPTTTPPVEPAAAKPADDLSFENATPAGQGASVGVSTPPAPETPAVASAAQPATASSPQGEGQELVDLREAMEAAGVNEGQTMSWAKSKRLAKPEQNHLSELATSKLASLLERWPDIVDRIKAVK